MERTLERLDRKQIRMTLLLPPAGESETWHSLREDEDGFFVEELKKVDGFWHRVRILDDEEGLHVLASSVWMLHEQVCETSS